MIKKISYMANYLIIVLAIVNVYICRLITMADVPFRDFGWLGIGLAIAGFIYSIRCIREGR